MKKLRSKKGFTLAEMLISVLLLGFVSVMVTVMTSAILNSTVTMQEVAQAEILGSEALDNLQWQLRVAQNVVVTKKEETGSEGITENDEVDSDSVTFDIDSANKGCTFDIIDGKIVIVHKIGEDEKSDPLFAGSTYGNLSITSLKFVVNEDNKTIEISVEVSFGEKPLWTGSVSVKPLNGLKL